jgi:hypothetical protein
MVVLVLIAAAWLISILLHSGFPPDLVPNAVDQYAHPKKESEGPVAMLTREPSKEELDAALAVFSTPITFYGKVVDQRSVPVSDATIEIKAQNTPLGNGKTQLLKSDANGLFSISGIHGANLLVKVSKNGWRQLTDLQGKAHSKPPSQKTFAYGWDRGSGIHMPDMSNPEIFMLQRPGVIEPLVTQPELRWYLPPGGGTKVVSLQPDQNPTHQIRVECRISQPSDPMERRYDWTLELTPMHGKIVMHRELFPFEAPESGYHSSETVKFDSAMGDQWKDRIEQGYFVLFDDHTFARLTVNCYARQKSLIVLQTWLNPKPGSRNLEDDASK